MPPKEARKYLLAVRASLSETPGVALDAVSGIAVNERNAARVPSAVRGRRNALTGEANANQG